MILKTLISLWVMFISIAWIVVLLWMIYKFLTYKYENINDKIYQDEYNERLRDTRHQDR